MFPNWTGWKTVKAVLFVLGGLVPTIVPSEYQHLAAVIVGAVGSIVVVLSGTSAGPVVLSKGGSS